ncbi:MAG: 1-acyl-sn-glycerol-3-phosphate acyltransferase [Eubacterium sp.]|nr:1-acyl-sn-glycerol-3-phosphate acyltransferase [Eubacterium sp.]
MSEEKKCRRHRRYWRILLPTMGKLIWRKFRFSAEPIPCEGAYLLITNHVTSYDPILLGKSSRKQQIYYVSSEHLFRLGWISKVISHIVDPIPRMKAASGADSVRLMLKRLKDGQAICLFAEGEQSWDGRSIGIVPSTGKMVRLSGVPLVTYRIEGGYLALPRWRKKICKGKVYGHPVKVYQPEELKRMKPEEITECINRDIYEDAWERQKQESVIFKGRKRAEGMETAVYLCPACRKIGTLHSKKSRVFCDCGFSLEYTETCRFEPAELFENVGEWIAWQKTALGELVNPRGAGDVNHADAIFSDEGITLSILDTGHEEKQLGEGRLILYADRLEAAGHTFPCAEIEDMAMVMNRRLLISTAKEYYEIRAPKGSNLKKYLDFYELNADHGKN